jgi:hypothetical protein
MEHLAITLQTFGTKDALEEAEALLKNSSTVWSSLGGEDHPDVRKIGKHLLDVQDQYKVRYERTHRHEIEAEYNPELIKLRTMLKSLLKRGETVKTKNGEEIRPCSVL